MREVIVEENKKRLEEVRVEGISKRVHGDAKYSVYSLSVRTFSSS